MGELVGLVSAPGGTEVFCIEYREALESAFIIARVDALAHVKTPAERRKFRMLLRASLCLLA